MKNEHEPSRIDGREPPDAAVNASVDGAIAQGHAIQEELEMWADDDATRFAVVVQDRFDHSDFTEYARSPERVLALLRQYTGRKEDGQTTLWRVMEVYDATRDYDAQREVRRAWFTGFTLDPLNTLLSLTAADALGAATEFKDPVRIRREYGASITSYQSGSVFGFAPGEATDDSQMVVATLLGYAQGLGLKGVRSALHAWLRAGPPDVGNLTRSALSYGTFDGGYRAWEASGRQSAGNGGLMRLAAVNLAGFEDDALLREAALVTALTHADPRCVLASVFLARFLERLGRAQEYEHAAEDAWKDVKLFDVASWLMEGGVLPKVERAAYDKALERAKDGVERAVYRGLAGEVRSQSGFVLDTLQAALAHGRHEEWRACVQPAVLLGEDSDTVACVTGAIVGARGLAVPDALLADLRLGHSWPGWERAWSCAEHFPSLLDAARVAVTAGRAS